MKATGIVRKIDHLGRIVLPMELRITMDINDGDPIEIFVDGDNIILRKHKSKCVLCGSSEDIAIIRNKPLCACCINEIRGNKIWQL